MRQYIVNEQNCENASAPMKTATNFSHRRDWLLGSLAVASLSANRSTADELISGLGSDRQQSVQQQTDNQPNSLGLPHFAPRAKRVIYLFQSGGPAQMDLWDYKPELARRNGEEVPKSVYPDDRKTTMSSAQASFPVAASAFNFRQHGNAGTWVSDAMPHIAGCVDDLCVIRSLHTDAINHDPAITFQQTGSMLPGRPSIGAWLSYGLGNDNEELPAFVAMSSKGSAKQGQPLYDRLWGSGFLAAQHQGVKFRNNGDPVLDIANPPGVPKAVRRKMLDRLKELNQLHQPNGHTREVQARIAQYELAFRLQTSVPELLDLSSESEHTLEQYGPDAKTPGKYAYNCVIARRLIERGVRFVQLFHQGWDSHGNLPKEVANQCRDSDQPTAALLNDLKQRGLLDDTLLVWGGEFGRTVYSQGAKKPNTYGRDHHPSCFSMWMAGGGIRGGMNYGVTDDYSVNVVENGLEAHDLNATLLHQMGIDHERLTFKYQARRFRLTDVHGEVVKDILS